MTNVALSYNTGFGINRSFYKDSRETKMEVRGKNRRERTPERERGRASVQIQMHETTRTTTTRVLKQPPPSFKKVQVVYYLSKNGQLEHPHFMEVTHLAHHHLRLKGIKHTFICTKTKHIRYISHNMIRAYIYIYMKVHFHSIFLTLFWYI